ncbi:MAG: DNA-3-methyladenine glycosylase [Gemmatimonadaceae bacterium]|nr:DNA-3-methyladenine glycosylase [Gemmatimonadaceae bacterium]
MSRRRPLHPRRIRSPWLHRPLSGHPPASRHRRRRRPRHRPVAPLRRRRPRSRRPPSRRPPSRQRPLPQSRRWSPGSQPHPRRRPRQRRLQRRQHDAEPYAGSLPAPAGLARAIDSGGAGDVLHAPPVRVVNTRGVLPASFYDRDPALVARELLGTHLVVHRAGESPLRARIVETEAYLGPHDPACHAVAGITRRTAHLHGPPGVAYVYRIYGMHWCLNAVTLPHGVGSAVLLRAVEPLGDLRPLRQRRPAARRDRDLTNGPGKLCAAYGITGADDGASLQRGDVRIAGGASIPDAEVARSPRIGITRAADWPLRFFVKDSVFVSSTPRHFVVTPFLP